jgi:hypothetical protein
LYELNGETKYEVIGTETIGEIINRVRKEGGRYIVIFEAEVKYWGA